MVSLHRFSMMAHLYNHLENQRLDEFFNKLQDDFKNSLVEALNVFDEMPVRDVVSWNSILS